MTGNRWWHVLFGVTMIFLVAVAAGSEEFGGGHRNAVFICLALLTVAYATIGWRALDDGRFALIFATILIVLSSVTVSFNPTMATIQAIAFPLLWYVLDDTRSAIIGNFALALGVGVGYVAGLGGDAETVGRAAAIEGVSLVGSLALGLWFTRVAGLSAERQRLLDTLTATQSQLALLSRDAGITSERERLAREMHDTVAQSLTGVVMLAQQARRDLDAGDLASTGDALNTLESSARDALVETRTLVAAGAPVELGAGVVAALDRVAARFGPDTGITVEFGSDGFDRATDASGPLSRDAELPRDLEVVLLRCAQEGLTNVRKHSAATDVWLELNRGDHEVRLTIRDNGVGFDPSTPSVGSGLPGMRDRVALAGGVLTISTAPGSGATLTAVLPVLAPEASTPPAPFATQKARV